MTIELSIIIVNWNTRQLLLDCLASIYSTVRKASFEIFVVDNGSSDASVNAVRAAYPRVTVIANPANEGFARANNMALKVMQGSYAVLLNSDTVLKEGAFDAMFNFMEANPEAGMCGPQLLFEDGTKQNSVGAFPTLLTEFGGTTLARMLSPETVQKQPGKKTRELSGPTIVDFIVGACMMTRSSAIARVGMLDEDYFFCFEEIDWCLRMKKAGWPVYHLPEIEIYHLQNRSFTGINLRARAESWRSRYVYFSKNLDLSKNVSALLRLAGGVQTAFHFLEYGIFNILTLFRVKRLRTRWRLFAYLLVWHLRGRPVAMCLPR